MGVTVFLKNSEMLKYYDGKDWRWSRPHGEVVNVVNIFDHDGQVIASFNLDEIVGLEKDV